jgi:hypothetical protein
VLIFLRTDHQVEATRWDARHRLGPARKGAARPDRFIAKIRTAQIVSNMTTSQTVPCRGD